MFYQASAYPFSVGYMETDVCREAFSALEVRASVWTRLRHYTDSFMYPYCDTSENSE